MDNRGLRARLRYRFDLMMGSGTIALIGLLVIVAFTLIGIATTLIVIAGLEPAGTDPLGFAEASWASLMSTLDPGAMGSDQGWGFRFVRLAVTITGVFIMAVLIGIITTGIDNRLDGLRKGRSLVLENDHTIILNWSDEIFEVLAQLAVANESRFRPRIVIMADRDKVEMESEIAAKVRDLRNSKVICRTGDPTDLHDIGIVNPRECRSIIILSPDTPDPDAAVIKTTLALVSEPGRRETPYRIAAEIRDSANSEIARLVGGSEVQLVLAADLVARIMVHSARQPGLSSVYTDLLDFEGCEIYASHYPDMAGMSVADAALSFEKCTLIGLCVDERVMLNPPPDQTLGENDRLILIAEDDERIDVASTDEAVAPTLPPPAEVMHGPERVLIIGWNKLAAKIVREFADCLAPNSLLTIAASNMAKVEDEVANLDLAGANFTTEVKRVSSGRRAQIEQLDPLTYDHVLVLGEGEPGDSQAADTRTLVTLLHLRAIRDAADAHVNIVSEVLDVRNVALAERARVDDFVVSSRLVSLMLAQASENELFEAIFEDLLDEEGSEIYLRPAANYAPLGQPVTFYDVSRTAAARGEVAIGHLLEAKEGRSGGTIVNPVKSKATLYTDADRIIVLARD